MSSFLLKLLKRFSAFLGLEKGLAYVTVGNVISTGLGAVLWFMLAAITSAEDYGNLNYYISIATITTAFGVLGFDSTLTTFLAKGMTKMKSESCTLVMLVGIIISLTLYLTSFSLSVIMIFLGMAFFTLSTAETLGRHLYKEFMLILIIQRVVTLVAVPILLLTYGVDGALYGFALSYFPLSYRFIAALKKFELRFPLIKQNKKFFFHSYAVGVSRTAAHFSDKLFIMPFYGSVLLGHYQFGIQVLTVIALLPIILYNFLLPQESSGNIKNRKKLLVLGTGFSLVLTTILIITIPYFVSVFFPQFEDAILSTQILLLAGTPMTLVSILSAVFFGENKSFPVFLSSGLFLAIQYGLIIGLGDLYGLEGLAISTVTAYVIQVMCMILMRFKYRQHNN
jgi:O-antigen/teichoic acid export membrane protein